MTQIQTEYQSERNPRYQFKSHQLQKQIPTDVQIQQNVIAALIRRRPQEALKRSTDLTGDEKLLFVQKTMKKRLDTFKKTDYKLALSLTPINIKEPRDEENLREIFQEFVGDDDISVRMRQVVAFLTKGNYSMQGQISPDNLFILIKQKYGNAVAFENEIPNFLEAIDKLDLPGTEDSVTAFLPALDKVGRVIYGKQWWALQQIRLAEEAVVQSEEAEASLERTFAAKNFTREMASRSSVQGIREGILHADSIDSRLEQFSSIERILLSDVPPPKFTLEDLQDSTQMLQEGNYTICMDRRMSREPTSKIIIGYNNKTGEVMAFKFTDKKLHKETASQQMRQSGDLFPEEVLRRDALASDLLTYSSRMEHGDEVIRAYPFMATDLDHYLSLVGRLNRKQALGLCINIGKGLRILQKHNMSHWDVGSGIAK